MSDTLRFPLCRQTVTLYHPDPAAQAVRRVVVRGVFLDRRRRAVPRADGERAAAAFLLVIPERAARFSADYTLTPQDRVLEGEGPEVPWADWPAFVPGRVDGLCVVQYVDPKSCGGAPSHVEAGAHWTTQGSGARSLTG